jgi:hypothetical protein
MKITWQRLGAGIGGALVGALAGAVMGFFEAYLAIRVSADLLGFSDQDGMIILAGLPCGAIHGGLVGLLLGLGFRNVGGWVLGTLVGLAFWGPMFLWGAHQHANITALLALGLPFCCGGFGAVCQAGFAWDRARQSEVSPAAVIREYENWKQKETGPSPEE